jgi:hypothetical protein
MHAPIGYTEMTQRNACILDALLQPDHLKSKPSLMARKPFRRLNLGARLNGSKYPAALKSQKK